MDDKETGLVTAFGKTLLISSVDPAIDFVEVAVDTLFEDGSLIEAIPIIKVIYGVGKTCISVRDKYLCKRLIAFIKEFNNGNLSQEQKHKHITELSDNKKLELEYEQVLQYIDQCTQELQAKYLGRFYQAYWKGDLSWSVFQELSEANQRMFIGDYGVMQYIFSDGCRTTPVNPDNESSVNRLISLGLIKGTIHNNNNALDIDNNFVSGIKVTLTVFGKIFGKYLDEMSFEDCVTNHLSTSLNIYSEKYKSPNEKRSE